MLDKVKIGGLVYQIEYKELESDDGIQLGWHRRPELLIEINNHNVNDQLQAQTLIHEIMHGVFDEAGIELEEEEDLVNRLSSVWYQVLRENNFDWLAVE